MEFKAFSQWDKKDLFRATIRSEKRKLKRPKLELEVTELLSRNIRIKDIEPAIKVGDTLEASFRQDGSWRIVRSNDWTLEGMDENASDYLDQIIRDHPNLDFDAVQQKREEVALVEKMTDERLSPSNFLHGTPNKKIVVLDFETTGLSPMKDRVVQFALLDATQLVQVTGKKGKASANVKGLSDYVNPTIPIPADAERIHGISDEKVKDAAVFSEFVDQILEFIEGAVIVGHNVEFDYRFLNAELIRAGREPIKNPVICTLRLARNQLRDHTNSFKLESVANVLKIPVSGVHDAAKDAALTAQVLAILLALKSSDNKPVQAQQNPSKKAAILVAVITFVVVLILMGQV